MDFSIFGQELSIKTSFSQKYDLIQMFRGIKDYQFDSNSPVDFRGAGLQRKNSIDMWHFEIPLAITTDEAIPIWINGDFAGGNHGRCCGNVVTSTSHGKDISDVASLWKDEEGTKWTLLRVLSENVLMFISENIGESEVDYAFKSEILGNLTYVSHGKHKEDIIIEKQSPNNQIQPSVKHTKKEIYSIKDGQRKREFFEAKDIDALEIVHEFDLINQATMPDALRKLRPKEGFKSNPYLGVGKTMARGKVIYRIDDDGTILVDFDYQNLSCVDFSICMGIMYQEKCNYGKGIYRYIPKQKPFEYNGVRYDFSVPCDTDMENYPHEFMSTPDTWENPNSPPDRQIDFIKDSSGKIIAGFAGGFLPVYEGEPSVRKNNINSAVLFYRTRKTYPRFKEGSRMKTARGVGYKKYFDVLGSVSEYRVTYGKTTYIYIDFFGEGQKELCEDVTIFEKSDRVKVEKQGNKTIISGKKGYAVLIKEQ